MKFPTMFEYGHLKYDIVQLPEMNNDDGQALGGQHRQYQGKLFVTTDGNTPEYQRLVLMHEIIHAIEQAHGLFELKEEHINGLSFGIIQAFAQNPWMKEFFG